MAEPDHNEQLAYGYVVIKLPQKTWALLSKMNPWKQGNIIINNSLDSIMYNLQWTHATHGQNKYKNKNE